MTPDQRVTTLILHGAELIDSTVFRGGKKRFIVPPGSRNPADSGYPDYLAWWRDAIDEPWSRASVFATLGSPRRPWDTGLIATIPEDLFQWFLEILSQEK